MMDDNQKVIESLVKIAMVCGMQELAFHGHRNHRIGWAEQEEEHGAQNNSNFIELVHFRAETDDVLCAHLQFAPKNA